MVKADMDAGGRTGNEDYGLSREDLEKISDVLSSLETDGKDDVDNESSDIEKGPPDTDAADAVSQPEPEAQATSNGQDVPQEVEIKPDIEAQDVETQTAPDVQEADTEAADAKTDSSPTVIEADGANHEQHYAYTDIEDYKDEILGPDEGYHCLHRPTAGSDRRFHCCPGQPRPQFR